MNNKPRAASRKIDVALEKVEDKIHIRQAKTFIPDETEILNEVPEPITSGERLPHISEYSGIKLEALPVKGLKSFFYGLAALLIVLVGWEVYSVLKSALATHWLIASSFVFLLVIVSSLGLRVLRSYWLDQENLSALEGIQQQACRLSEAHDIGNAKAFIKKLSIFYSDKPHSIYFQNCIEQLPDYSNDREVIDHIERVFLQPLDKEALRRVSSFSLQTGMAVAASPWASVDMLLSLWRSIKMMDDVAQVYGMRPSLTNRYKLLRLVMQQLALVGTSEIVINNVMEEFTSSALTNMASARIGQGLGAGIYTARIGIAAMQLSRPIEFSINNQPKIKSIIEPVIEKLKAMMSRC